MTRSLLSRLNPLPKGRIETVLFGLFYMSVAVFVLTLCSGCASGFADSVLPATRDYAAQVAADNAANAPTNPFSAVISGVAALVASLSGAGILVKRGIQKYDDAPYTPADVAELEKAKAVAEVEKKAGA